MSAIQNRLEKNHKKLQSWAERLKIEAFRLYDRDIPEYPFIVDVYKDHYVVYDRRDERLDLDPRKAGHLDELIAAIGRLFGAGEDRIVIKRRERKKGEDQYEKLGASNRFMTVREGPALFRVNLYDYLDTGLFLDHRLMRERMHKVAGGKSFLNLFSYTGSVSVFAALGGAATTSVDMSATYSRWAQDNFELNGIPLSGHEFVTMNALEFLAAERGRRRFDLIFLDPPTFSNSKRMDASFEVERDQVELVDGAMSVLRPGGTLYFSNNKRTFRLDPSISERYAVKDLTAQTIPKDFHDQKIHQVFEIQTKPGTR